MIGLHRWRRTTSVSKYCKPLILDKSSRPRNVRVPGFSASSPSWPSSSSLSHTETLKLVPATSLAPSILGPLPPFSLENQPHSLFPGILNTPIILSNGGGGRSALFSQYLAAFWVLWVPCHTLWKDPDPSHEWKHKRWNLKHVPLICLPTLKWCYISRTPERRGGLANPPELSLGGKTKALFQGGPHQSDPQARVKAKAPSALSFSASLY